MRLMNRATGAVLLAVLTLVLVAPPAPAAEPQLVEICKGVLRTVTSPGILDRLGQRSAPYLYSLVADAVSGDIFLIMGGDGFQVDVVGGRVERDRDGGERWVYEASVKRPYTVTYRPADASVTIDYPGRNVVFDVHGSFPCPDFKTFIARPDAFRSMDWVQAHGEAGTGYPVSPREGGSTDLDDGRPARAGDAQDWTVGQAPAESSAQPARASSTDAGGDAFSSGNRAGDWWPGGDTAAEPEGWATLPFTWPWGRG